MAKIYINPTPAGSVLEQEKSLVQNLNTLSMDLSNVQRNLRYKIAAQEQISASLTEVISQVIKEKTAVNALKDGLAEIIEHYKKSESINIEKLVAITAALTKTSYNRPTGQELVDASSEEKDKFIKEFEKENPKLARIFDEFLSGGKNNTLTENDIRNMKYLAYNADEPFRTIFLNSLSKFSIGNCDMDEGAFYRQFFHTVNFTYDDSLNKDSFGNDPRGPYTTFFHECGHAIDDLSDVSKWWGSDTEKFTAHSDVIGRDVTLREAIEYDVYYNTNNPHSMTSLANEIKASGVPGSNGNVENVIAALQSGVTSKLVTNEDLKLYNAVLHQHQRTTGSSAQYESVSDVYGGMSNNALRTNYGHSAEYWTDKTMAAKELWAEYFAYNMSGSMENLEHLLEYFPEAAKVMEQYANTLGGQF